MQLRGTKTFLESLRVHLECDDRRVLQSEDSFELWLRGFDSVDDARAVFELATSFVARLHGALTLHPRLHERIALGSPLRTERDGHRSMGLLLEPIDLGFDLHGALLVEHQDGAVDKDDPLKTVADWLSEASSTKSVAEVLESLSVETSSWYTLYKAFECIQDDCNGVMFTNGWCTRRRAQLFARTAQSTRHSATANKMKPPIKPMTLLEGDAFIRDMAAAWLGWKSRQSSP